ncbi:conserved hypothetical protein [Ricinus communis]|uniref:Uncharacterized protein n=1 Tax=Ricinus communis TaxID=3988 RepID=B9S2C5_RICCO|nr:conserved hypothetical protein [Ricinus communis]
MAEAGTSNERFISMGKRHGDLEPLDVGKLEWLDLGDFSIVVAAVSGDGKEISDAMGLSLKY